MSQLQLTARSEGRNDRHARIGVFQNGGKAGVLTVDAEHEAKVIGLINATGQLLEACKAVASFPDAWANDPTGQIAKETWQGVLEQVNSAIAKAEGKSDES